MQSCLRAAGALVFAAPLVCQVNAIPGLDARVHDIVNVDSPGRGGAAYPNGEVAVGIGHASCNVGTVNIPCLSLGPGSTMLDTYPRCAFLVVRERDGRMVQISGRSFVHHARTLFNNIGPCGPCNNAGSSPSPFLFTGCTDTSWSSTTASRFNLGPATEIDPWLGTWNPIGSYFDRGDPPVTGAAATDGVESLMWQQVNLFGPLKNRVVVPESELVGGGRFFSQVHLMVVGEPVQDRADNTMNRPCTMHWTGSFWAPTATGTAQHGSVLGRWQGATVATGGNGTDDGRFAAGARVTGPIGGLWHYEYAVHNLDNARGGAALRIPVDASATVSNAGFRDIDGDALNQWTFARTGTEISFTAAAGNAVEWNTIYNVWFDCSVPPSFGPVSIDEARAGAGALTVAVQSEIPSGVPAARVTSVGTSCGGCFSSFYEYFTPSTFDLANSAMTMRLSGGAYTVSSGQSAFVAPTGTLLPLLSGNTVTVALPFSFPYPGGSTSSLAVCSSGFVSVNTSNGHSATPTVAALLSRAPRWVAAWHNWNPPAGQVLADVSPAGFNLTWLNVPSVFGPGSTFQYQFLPDGTVHIVWQAMHLTGAEWLVGWSPGGGAPDPGNRDLSATLSVPFVVCPSSYAGLTLSASARPILGTSFTMTIGNVPVGATFAALLLSPTEAVPPTDLSGVGMTGCFAHVDAGSAWSYLYLAPPVTVPTVLTVPSDPYFLGAAFATQSFAFSLPLTAHGAIATDAQILTLGL